MGTLRFVHVLAFGALGLVPANGLATDGALYPYGAGGVSGGRQWTVTTPRANVWQIGAPPLRPALAEPAFAMSWGCPAPGTQIDLVQFDALRYAAASTLELQVLSGASPVYRIPDAWIPASPAPGMPYAAAMPAGTCAAQLRLIQVAQVPEQFNRTYWIGQPRILVRDLAPPSATVTGVTPGWIPAGRNQIDVQVAAQDNMGADGMGQQRLYVAGALKWSGAPGPGAHAVSADLTGVGDGPQEIRYEVDGDGTPGTTATGTVLVDRTAPAASIVATKASPTADLVSVGVADQASGVARWTARVGAPDGPVIATSETSGATGATIGPLDLSSYPPGTDVPFFLTAVDKAGNTATATSRPVRVGTVTGPFSAATAGQALDFSRVRMFSITARQTKGAFRYCGTKAAPRPCVIVPYLVTRWGRTVTIAGRYGFSPTGRGLRGATVVLTGPAERSTQRAVTFTDRRGRFTLSFRPRTPGAYTVRLVGGNLDVSNPVTIAIRPVIHLARGRQTVRVGHAFTVQGQLQPRFWAARKLLQLQYYDFDQRQWRPLTNGAVQKKGRFSLRYRFGGSRRNYAVRVRIAAQRERGWRFAPAVSAPFTLVVR